MRYPTRLIAACLCSVVLAACGSSPTTPDEPVPLPNQELDGRPKTTGVVIDDANEGQKIDPDSVAGRAPAERVIFFDYDQDEIRTEYLDVVARHGRFLAENPKAACVWKAIPTSVAPGSTTSRSANCVPSRWASCWNSRASVATRFAR